MTEDKKFAMQALLGIGCFVILYIAYRYLVRLAKTPKKKKNESITNKALGTNVDGIVKPLGKIKHE